MITAYVKKTESAELLHPRLGHTQYKDKKNNSISNCIGGAAPAPISASEDPEMICFSF